jgi:hypothetical protein
MAVDAQQNVDALAVVGSIAVPLAHTGLRVDEEPEVAVDVHEITRARLGCRPSGTTRSSGREMVTAPWGSIVTV